MPDPFSAKDAAVRGVLGFCPKVTAHLMGRNFGVVNRQLSPFLQKVLADADGGSLTGVICVRLEGKAKNGNALTGQGSEEPLHNALRNPIMLPGIELDDALPIGSLGIQSGVAAKVDEVKDVFLETAGTEARTRLEELGTET